MAFAVQSLWDVLVLLALVLAVAPWVGSYVGRVFLDRPLPGDFFLVPVESAVYRLLGTSPRRGMRPREYMVALLCVNVATWVFLYVFFALQASLPGDPTGVPNMSWDLAAHSATSFVTNTDFTHFTNEAQVSYASTYVAWQLALFVSPATGLSVLAAMARGFSRKDGIVGNFYVDLTRALTRILFPLAVAGGLVFLFLGLPETLRATVLAHPLTGGLQTIYLGPVASFQSISLVGTNGGGAYAANFASPLADPSVGALLFGTFLLMLIPFSTPFAFATMVRKRAEAWPFVGVIVLVVAIALGLYIAYQATANPLLTSVGGLGSSTNGYPVGAETRWSLSESSMFQVMSVYTNTGANVVQIGAINPLPQLVLLFGMFTQATPGGDGTGFAMLLVFTILAIYVGGLMVGRTPEYLGKKIELPQVRWAAVALVLHPALILLPFVATVVSGRVPFGGSVGVSAHTFSSVLYEFTSESANNGSALSTGAFNDTTVFFNVAGAVVMAIGRFVPIYVMLRIGGQFAQQDSIPPGPGTLRTASGTFSIYLAVFVIVATALVFLPVMALGPLSQILGGA
jgi:K+-transporting ATPase ATPase A chain